MFSGWKDDAEAFMAWIDNNLGPCPGKGWSLDRIDNDGDYEPGNLRWATQAMQNANKQRPNDAPLRRWRGEIEY
jgi:hypothetical protein